MIITNTIYNNIYNKYLYLRNYEYSSLVNPMINHSNTILAANQILLDHSLDYSQLTIVEVTVYEWPSKLKNKFSTFETRG